jgi:hypothetical protein
MKSLRKDDRAQIHTMEGVVAGLVLVLTLMYITGSITFLSPQTEKTTVVKLNLKAQDVLVVLGSEDQTSSFSSPLSRDILRWEGNDAGGTVRVSPAEPTIQDLDSRISSLLPENVYYNVYLVYNQSGTMVTRTIIFQGDPQDNAPSASKIIVLNKADVQKYPSCIWKVAGLSTPKVVEVRIVMWSI